MDFSLDKLLHLLSEDLLFLHYRIICDRSKSSTSYLWRHYLQSRRIQKQGPVSTICVDPLSTH